MRVLPISSFDAILGYDWLQNHSPMECDWKANILSFMDENVPVVLKGDEGEDSMMVQQISVSQLHKWEKANEVWAFVLVETSVEQQTHSACRYSVCAHRIWGFVHSSKSTTSISGI
jgi:hypothetical protein